MPLAAAVSAPADSEAFEFGDQPSSSGFLSSHSGLDGKDQNDILVRNSERTLSVVVFERAAVKANDYFISANFMKKTAILVCAWFWINLLPTVAQPSFPWPPSSGGGGPNTNPPPELSFNPPYTVPGLKVTIPTTSSTNFHFSLLEADPNGKYAIFYSSTINSSDWSNVLEGVTGQTNFILPIPTDESGYFRAARMDVPVISAADLSVYFPYDTVGTNMATALIEGDPALSMAVSTNCTAISNAVWIPFNAVPLVVFGTNEGVHEICFGLKGSDGIEHWSQATITLDLTPPTLVVTNLPSGSTERPIVQIQGYATERLAALTFDVINTVGTLTNAPGFVIGQFFDTNSFQFTTNWFQCFDVGLANGTNTIVIRATDIAGNVATTNLLYVLDISGDTNPPTIKLIWPLDGMHLSGTNFTARGTLDDETAQIIAEIVDASGATNRVDGSVERNGQFWVDELPLSAGTNHLVLTALDAAGNFTTTNLSLIKSAVELVINPIDENQLNRNTVTINGTVSDASFEVWINGVQATVDESCNWTAEEVPIYGNGTAIFDASAYLAAQGTTNTTSQPQAVTSFSTERPPSIYTSQYQDSWTQDDGTYGHWTNTKKYVAEVDDAGRLSYNGISTSIGNLGPSVEWWWDVSYAWSDSDPVGYSTAVENIEGHTEAANGAGLNSLCGYYMHNTKSVPSASSSSIFHYFCKIDYHWDVFFGKRRYARNARTTQQLKTGGRSGVNKKTLFTISAGATSYHKPEMIDWGNGPDDWVNTPATNISPTLIRTLGENFGTDGLLHKALPDNATLDLTATAPFNHYNANVTATKHRLVILANGYPLDQARVRPGAEFCVGQKLNFEATFVPVVPSLVIANPRWIFPGEYINYHYTDINGCEQYLVGTYWHTQNPTRVWYYNKGESLNAAVGLYCTFENGQTAYPYVQGKYDIYRPELTHFEFIPPVTITNRSQFGFTLLSLGGENNWHCMTYGSAMTSKVEGEASITQLVKSDRTRDRVAYPGYDVFSTDGRFDLDTSEWYQGFDLILGGGSQSGLENFQDGPGYQRGATFTTISDEFKDYIRFRPLDDESIWVTIKRIDWSWSASESAPIWMPTGIVSGPTAHDDFNFPVWTHVATGNGGSGD